MVLFSRSDIVSIDPSGLKESVAYSYISQDFQVAIAALLVYDTIITFDNEVKHFWKIPQSPVDFIYFMNRYIGILGAVATLFGETFTETLPLASGHFSQWTKVIASWISIISIDYILTIRVLALYSKEKRLSICLKVLLALEAVFKLGMAVYLNTAVHIVLGVYGETSLCGVTTFPAWQLGMIDWLVPLAYGTLLMILALYKAAEYWRMSSGLKGFTLVKVLIEDQVVYFALVISVSVFGVMQFRLFFSNLFLSAVFAELGNPAFLSLLGSRMLFNLKEAGEQGQNGGTSYRTPSRTTSSIDFAEPVNPQRESGAGISGSEQTV